jgi:hypothetical protein
LPICSLTIPVGLKVKRGGSRVARGQPFGTDSREIQVVASLMRCCACCDCQRCGWTHSVCLLPYGLLISVLMLNDNGGHSFLGCTPCRALTIARFARLSRCPRFWTCWTSPPRNEAGTSYAAPVPFMGQVRLAAAAFRPTSPKTSIVASVAARQETTWICTQLQPGRLSSQQPLICAIVSAVPFHGSPKNELVTLVCHCSPNRSAGQPKLGRWKSAKVALFFTAINSPAAIIC